MEDGMRINPRPAPSPARQRLDEQVNRLAVAIEASEPITPDEGVAPKRPPAPSHAEQDNASFAALMEEIDRIAASGAGAILPTGKPLVIVHGVSSIYPVLKAVGKRVSYLARRLGAKPVPLAFSGDPIAEGIFVGDGQKEYYDIVEMLNRLLDALGVPA